MNTNKSNLQQVIEHLIQRLETHMTESQFEIKDSSQDDNVYTSGRFAVKYSIRVKGNISVRCFDFLIKLDSIILCRGIMGHAPILYAKQNQKLRENLLAKESIEGIITILHSKYSFSKVAFILFDKRNSSTWFASCNEVKDAVSFLLGEGIDTVSVHHSEIVYPENMLPDYYSKEKSVIDATFKSTQTKCLEELAEIIPGKSAKSIDYRETGIPFLRARDIQNGSIVNSAVCLEPKMAVEFSRQLIQEGDILLTKFFSQRKLALVSEENLPAIASGALYIIRPFGVSERYLYRYLSSKTGNAVFNLQLKRIEKGTAFSSIALSDLKKVLVPIYNEDTMLDFEKMDELSAEDGIESALKIIQAVGYKSEIDIEKHVHEELISTGWKAEKLSRQDAIILENGKRWIPDLTYTLPGNIKVYFEVKKVMSKASSEWVSAIKKVLQGSSKCFYVLTTGYYYEVHVTGSTSSLKLLHAPTVSEILDWERGQN